MRRIVVVGAAGQMISITVRAMLDVDADIEMVLADVASDRLGLLVDELGRPANVATATVDLHDRPNLVRMLAGADLVMNGTGPCVDTAPPVIEACLAARASYLDLGDDIPGAQYALAASRRAREAGVGLYVGCGVSPGITNVLVRELVELLDAADAVEVAFLVGDEGPHPLGRAVLKHALRMAAGETLSWWEGGPVAIPSFRIRERVLFAPAVGEVTVYEVAHPEVVTIPHFYPWLRSVRVLGGMYPQATNGLLQGLGAATADGSVTVDEAVDFLQALTARRAGSATAWRAALTGVLAQWWRGENTLADLLGFLVDGVLGRHRPFVGGVVARATGMRDGQRVTLERRTVACGPGTPVDSMAGATGRAAAAFASLALARRGAPGGAFAPEAWGSTKAFHRALARYGITPDALGPVREVAAAARGA